MQFLSLVGDTVFRVFALETASEDRAAGVFIVTMPKVSLIRASFLAVVPSFAADELLINRLGYEFAGPKSAVVKNSTSTAGTTGFEIFDVSGKSVLTGSAGPAQTVPGWGSTSWKVLDFSALSDSGSFTLKLSPSGDTASFSVRRNNLLRTAGQDVVSFFKSMRNTDEADKAIGYYGQPERGTHDVFGGWWDATGDDGKYLSHLSYANFMNPQQIPMVVWALLRARTMAPATTEPFKDALLAEATWGADYLLRVQDTAGYFYINIYDRWNADKRMISAWTGTAAAQGTMNSDYQAAWREGGGMSIAALAMASRMGLKGDFTSAQYLEGAKRGFEHLSSKAGRWADDGRENLIDHYCALLAGLELFLASGDLRYLDSAGARADSIVGRQRPEGWFVSDAGARPFYHGVDEGLPLMALSVYLEIDGHSARSNRIRQCLIRSLSWYRSLTREVANPFVYPRMYAPLAPAAGAAGSGNVALGKQAVATSVEGAGREAAKAVDGKDDAGNRWASAIESSKPVDGSIQALVVNLADRYQVSSISVSWETAKAVDFNILVAVDSSRWDTLQKVVGNSSALTKFNFTEPVWARYIKVLCLKRANQNWPFSIQELVVTGQKEFVPIVSVPSKSRFFMPHANETDYWWQGENARLGSMSAGLLLAGRMSGQGWNFGTDSLSQEVIGAVDWVAGKNSENINFVFGVNGSTYAAYNGSTNYKGGICNGITAISDTNQAPVFNNDGGIPNWRWVEQWLPHDANFLLAIAAIAHSQEFPDPVAVKSTRPKIAGFQLVQVGSRIELTSSDRSVWTLRSVSGRIEARAEGAKVSVPVRRGAWVVERSSALGERSAKSFVVH